MLLLGIDIGTSSVKVSIVDAETAALVHSDSFPDTEAEIISLQSGWAEQSPLVWWEHVKQAILKCHAAGAYHPKEIKAIGIAYQMHGLVCVDDNNECIRNSIIWCDSRAVDTGNKAFQQLGYDYCSTHLLNAPGNFTASKLAWVKKNEHQVYERIKAIMLPGDFIALQFTGSITTTISALSEGIFWDFKHQQIAEPLFESLGIDSSFIPEIKDVFSVHGLLQHNIAVELHLTAGIPVTYKAGDQPNNALSLNVLQPGEVAATAGTSGVIYGVTDSLIHDRKFRINSFAHVNYTKKENRIGALLCINGAGIFNKWIKQIAGCNSYSEMNELASTVEPGSNGLFMFPFGNGVERMLENKVVGAQIKAIDLNRHHRQHLLRAAQEAIAFSFRYGLDIMKENNLTPTVIKAGRANMFLSDVFVNCFTNTLDVPVELYDCDGSFGAAIGAGIGAGIFKSAEEAFASQQLLVRYAPQLKQVEQYNELYYKWKEHLHAHL
jgi:xylulokinase